MVLPLEKPGSTNPRSSFDAFSKVDELVSKPVLGSDGAASWQSFRKDKSDRFHKSSAPKAPLKKADKLGTGFSTWEEERAHENRVRESSGHASANAGYTVFQTKNNHEEGISKKQRANIESRIRPADKDYFIPSKTFQGWKFDYVFTTRNRHDATGYYWDGMDSLKKLRGDLKGMPETTAKEEETGTTAKRTEDRPQMDKPKKKRKRKKGPVIVNDPNNPMEQVQAILQRRNQQWMGTPGMDPILPSGWETAKDPSTGKAYYFHRDSGTRTWERPKESPDKPSKGDGNEGLPQGWKSAFDSASGKTYYHHTSGETTWTKPQ